MKSMLRKLNTGSSWIGLSTEAVSALSAAEVSVLQSSPDFQSLA